jgi:murein L,D-transpeptidase YcbB/YkuD
MNIKHISCLVLVLFMAIAAAGCSTMPKKHAEEIAGIKTKVDTLEARVEGVEMKQAESDRMVMEQSQMAEERMVTTNFDVKPRAGKSKDRVREIQSALKNAGYYDGAVDGIKGKKTKKAIREFQKANGLTADGIVGKRTWEVLSRYAKGQGSGEIK